MYEKVTFAKTVGASLGVLLLVAAIGVYGGVAYAVPVAGMGSYQVAADQINAGDTTVYPQLDPNGQAEAVIELQNTEIEGLRITKQTNNFNLVVSADGTVTSDEMLIHATHLDAAGSDLNNVKLDPNSDEIDTELEVSTGNDLENGETVSFDDPEDQSLYLEDFQIETHYLVTNQISIPDLSLDIESGGGDDDGDE